MWLAGDTLFKWDEPRHITKSRALAFKKYLSVKGILIIACFVAMMLIPFWFIAWINPKQNAMPLHKALPLLIGVSLFLGWFCPFMHYKCYQWFPAVEFKITKNAIKSLGLSNNKSLLFKKFSAFEFIMSEISTPDLLIQFITNEGKTVQVGGISQKDSIELKRVLQEAIGLEYRK